MDEMEVTLPFAGGLTLPLTLGEDGKRSVRPAVATEESTPSDKLIEGDFESAAALARQGFYAPSEELVTVSPQTVPHNTGDGSSTTALEEHVEGIADSTTFNQVTDVSSSEELLDATLSSLEELIIATQQTVLRETTDGSPPSEVALQGLTVSSSKELLNTTPSEELVIASPQKEPHNTNDGSMAVGPFIHKEHVGGTAQSASAQSLPDLLDDSELLDDSTLQELLDTASSFEELNVAIDLTVMCIAIIHGSPLPASSVGSKILTWKRPDWYQVYHIRLNRWGSFSMYPDLGGPFQSIPEAKGAINYHLDELRRTALFNEPDELSMDSLIRDTLYYLDGTPKRGPDSPRRKNKNMDGEQYFLVQALVEQYNDDNNLFGNLAHEIENLRGYARIYEDGMWYNHLNFTTKTKEGGDGPSSGNLFFAEVVSGKQGEHAWEIKCCCMIRNDENGHCYGCRNNGSPAMKHPNHTGAYTGGHMDAYLPFGCINSDSEDEDEETREATLRSIYKGLDDPNFLYRRAMSRHGECRITRYG